ncbi:MAG: dethiobiotin synthase [Thiomicrorhabdus sp.]|nr:dethiobiotin synthase [Thiomicrorhabdus sp.]
MVTKQQQSTQTNNVSTGVFITGTDTDVGKTFVACCIATTLIQKKFSVSPRKPIASGCIRQADNSLLSEDALFLQQACLSTEPLNVICPYQFEPAISPQRVIQEANLNITIQDLKRACDTSNNNSIALIEGAGGFYSPIALNGLNKDLAVQLNYPIVLVVANRIGCINQTLLTIEAIQNSELKLHSIIINNITNDLFNYAKELDRYTKVPIFNVRHTTNKKPQPITDWSLF